MIRIITICLLIMTGTSFAYEAFAYYVEKNRFSLDGYDFIVEDQLFPIVEGKIYDVIELGEEQLASGSYKKLIQITDLETQESDLFMTRLINNTKRAVVLEARQTKNKFFEEHNSGDGFGGGSGSEWKLEVEYELVLEDGGILYLPYNKYYGRRKPESNPNFLLFPGDQIEILSELRGNRDFTRTNFEIKITRDEQMIGIFGFVSPFVYSSSVRGTERQDINFHGENKNIYVVENSANDVKFYGIQGVWMMPHSSTYTSPPYTGRQFEFIQLKDNKLQLRSFNSDELIEFIRVANS